MILPRPHISYSQYILWKQSPDRYKRKYFEGEDDFNTVETRFGKEFAQKLEDGGSHDGVVPYDISEYEIKVELVPGLMLLGKLDGFREKDLGIVELKTGHKNKAGKSPWDNVKVRKHKQLPFYCLLVQLKHGSYNPDVVLQWLETEFANNTVEFDGHILTCEKRELQMTGYIETFNRHIEQWEIDNLKEDIINVANEISTAYEQFRKRNNE